MTLHKAFEDWLQTYFPEADRKMVNGTYINSMTRYLWVGFRAGIEFNAKAQRESA